ncbi:hypothetical protein HAX54_045336 [Datura stramonium]|uniref:Uncharacterized protein n=1 Tax=Datura stramonium TaxID=4076 RepID=A0ABS8SQ46_DATST|nr:hypothetical protein [Datura stramonium]
MPIWQYNDYKCRQKFLFPPRLSGSSSLTSGLTSSLSPLPHRKNSANSTIHVCEVRSRSLEEVSDYPAAAEKSKAGKKILKGTGAAVVGGKKKKNLSVTKFTNS